MYPQKALKLSLLIILFLSACTPPAATPSPSPPAPGLTQPEARATTTPPPEPFVPPDHPIAIRQVHDRAEFYHTATGDAFSVRGTNLIKIVRTPSGRLQDRLLGTSDFEPDVIRAQFVKLHDFGYNTVRIFIDACSEGPTCIGSTQGAGLNPLYVDNLATLMEMAREEEIFLLLTSNDLPSGGGYSDIADRDPLANPQVELYRNGQMLTQSGQDAYRLYWQDLMTALSERQAAFDAVLAWELFNEQWLFLDQPPLSLSDGTFTGVNGLSYDLSDPEQKRDLVADSIAHYIETVRPIIIKADPQALITMGFFTPNFPNETRPGDFRFVDTAALIARNVPLDFYDIHAYPGDELPLTEIMENFGMTDYQEKPVILGEYGAFEGRYANITSAARATSAWAAGFCQLGVDGLLYWTMTDLPEALGDPTWGLVEQDDFLLKLFAPTNLPDPCSEPEVRTDNLAYGAAVTASRSLAEEPPEAIVDENTTTSWGAGADAPQWIEIDLGENQTVSLIRLLVAQYPAGPTKHEVQVRRDSGVYETVYTFEENTQDMQWLGYTPDPPLENVRYIRIRTLVSPSWVAWREIEIE